MMKKIAVGVFALLSLLYAVHKLQVAGSWQTDSLVTTGEAVSAKLDERTDLYGLVDAQGTIPSTTESVVTESVVDAGTRAVTSPRPAIESLPKGVLPAEAILVDGDTLNITSATSLLDSQRFSESLELLRAQAASDGLARDVFQLYSGAAVRIADGIEGVAIKDMACGRKLCMGSMSGANQDQAISWADSIGDDPRTPILVFLNAKFERENGTIERRFIFSSDPEVDGVMASW